MENFNRDVKITDNKFLENMTEIFLCSSAFGLAKEIIQRYYEVAQTGVVSSNTAHDIYLFMLANRFKSTPFITKKKNFKYIKKVLDQYFVFIISKVENDNVQSIVSDREKYEDLLLELESNRKENIINGDYIKEVTISDKKFLKSMEKIFFSALYCSPDDEFTQSFYDVSKTGYLNDYYVYKINIYIHYIRTGEIESLLVQEKDLEYIKMVLDQHYFFLIKEEGNNIRSFTIPIEDCEAYLLELKSVDEK